MMPPIAILAGGYATRLYPVTKSVPKALLPVAGKPFIARQMALLKKNGISSVVICTGYLGSQIQDYVGDGTRFGMSVSYSWDGEEPLGTGGAVRKALPLLGDCFFVTYGDSYLDTDYGAVSDFFFCQNKQGLITVFKNEGKWDKSNIIFKNGKIITYDKKQESEDVEYIDYGLSVLRRSAFDEMGREKIFDLELLYRSLVDKGQMIGYEVKKRFYEIGSIEGLAETERYLLSLPGEDKGTHE